jgi:hypothetical protein
MPAEPRAEPAESHELSRSCGTAPGAVGSGFPPSPRRARDCGGHLVPMTGRAFPIRFVQSAYGHDVLVCASPVAPCRRRGDHEVWRR